MRMKNVGSIFLLFFLVLSISACDELILFENTEIVFDNPRDPGSDSFVRPGIQINLSPVYDTELVNLAWNNVPNSTSTLIQHRFRVLGESFVDIPEWSNWQSERNINRVYDEGDVSVQIQSRYAGFVSENTYGDTTLTFQINSIDQPAIMVRPRRTQIFNAGNEFTVGVWVKNVTEVTAADIQLYYNNAQLEIVYHQTPIPSFFNGVDVIELTEVIQESNFNNVNVLKKAVALTGINPPGVSGEGFMVEVRFRVRSSAPSGQSIIGIADASQLRTGSASEQVIPHIIVNKSIIIQ
jgi:hypothetical protein